jgi:hypothetical protein
MLAAVGDNGEEVLRGGGAARALTTALQNFAIGASWPPYRST